MATDFEGGLPIKTARDNEVKIILVDKDSGSEATNKLAINEFSAAKTSVYSADNNALFIAPDGSIKAAVTISKANEDLVCKYEESLAVAKAAVVDHDYIVTSAKNFIGCTVLVGARGAVKVSVGTFDGTDFIPKATWYQLPAVNESKSVQALKVLGDGTTAIRVRITNLDNATDIHSTIQGEEE